MEETEVWKPYYDSNSNEQWETCTYLGMQSYLGTYRYSLSPVITVIGTLDLSEKPETGDNRREKNQEIYDLIREIQPLSPAECMTVSDRLGSCDYVTLVRTA